MYNFGKAIIYIVSFPSVRNLRMSLVDNQENEVLILGAYFQKRKEQKTIECCLGVYEFGREFCST